MSNRKYTIEQFSQAVSESLSIAQALIKLGLAPKGGNYSTFNKFVYENNIDITHFTGQCWNKGQTIGPKRDISDYLTNTQTIQSNKLRKRLLKDKVMEYKCSSCGNIEWLNQPIPLELDHINGNNQDNSLTNLRLLCPNCHALTSTYRGKNKSKA
jgi:hypothetical protein